MKKILYLLVFALLSSCLTEKNADPGKPSTFVRYFNGGNSDNALVSEETADGGIIILATTKIVSQTDSLKIKLIKTDNYGNLLVQKLYPTGVASKTNLSGNTLLQLPENKGFMVIGTQTTATRKDIFVMEVDNNLDSVKRIILDFTPFGITESIQGRAIHLNSSGNYLILGAIVADTDNMLLAELDKTSLSIKWVKKYGAGKSNLSNKIFLDASNNVFWSGTVTRNSADIRLVKTAQNSLNTLFDLPIGTPNFEEAGTDICRYGFGFAVIGSTNQKTDGTAGDQDILFKVLAEDGTELLSKSIEGYGDTDTGNSICTVRGGIAILGTVRVSGQDEYILTKYDAFGNQVWNTARVFGNKTKNDTGASVRQMSDGSLLILGTTVFGNVNTIMLMKADSEGNIE